MGIDFDFSPIFKIGLSCFERVLKIDFFLEFFGPLFNSNRLYAIFIAVAVRQRYQCHTLFRQVG